MAGKKVFEKLDDVYEHIEKKAMDYKHTYKISKLFINLRDSEANQGSDESIKAQWEIDFFAFTFLNGISDINGNKIEYPSLENFNDNTYEYLKSRLEYSNNPLIRSVYSTILWLSPYRHMKYAKISVRSFIDLAKIYEEKDKENPEDNWGYKSFIAIKNAFFIALQSNHDLEEIKTDIKRLIKTFYPKSSSCLVMRLGLIELMLENKRIFKKDDFKGLLDVLCQIYDYSKEKADLHTNIEILKLMEKVNNKLGNSEKKIIRLIAENYESLADKAFSEKNFLAIKFCSSAISYYNKIKAFDKIKSLEAKYKLIIEEMELPEIKIPIDLSEINNQIDKEVDRLLKLDSEEIISYLINPNRNILPNRNFLNQNFDEQSKFSFFGLSTTMIIDNRGHPTKYYSSVTDKELENKIKYFDSYIKIITNNFLDLLLKNAIKEGKLSLDILIQFLRNHSWLGKPVIYNVWGTHIEHDWINFLFPALKIYFDEINKSFFNPKAELNFILSIDSLVLKVEGIVRDICRKNKISTLNVSTKDDKQISTEKSLKLLLDDNDFIQIVGEENVFFLKYLLIDRGGYNLRNEIAHSLATNELYNEYSMNLLILAILILANNNFENNDG